MTSTRANFLNGAGWTFGAFLASLSFRFGTNIILTRLLAPEIFGAMVIINTIRLGVSLTADVGLQQNIIHSKNGEEPEFYNSAWTLQVIRGTLLFLICAALAVPVGDLYGIPASAIQIMAICFIFSGATSLSVALALKRMNFRIRNVYDASMDFVSLVVLITMAYLNPTIWSLVTSSVISTALRCAASFLLPSPDHRLTLSREHIMEIWHFGKWILLTSLLFFAAGNADRLYLGQLVPLTTLGIFGIARALSELPTLLALRLANYIVMPIVSAQTGAREERRAQLYWLRFFSMLAAAVGLSVAAAIGDIVIAFLYDERYVEAGWMLTILLFGSWAAVVCGANESVLMGLGRPVYATFANVTKLVWLIVALPIAFGYGGLLPALVAIALADYVRYIPIFIGQQRERFGYAAQDLGFTILVFVMFGCWVALRQSIGWGNPLTVLALW